MVRTASGEQAQPTGALPSPPSGSHRAVAEWLIDELLARAPALPGAREVDHPPVASLDDSMGMASHHRVDQGERGVVHVVRWWITALDPAAAITHILHQRSSRGLTSGGVGQVTGVSPRWAVQFRLAQPWPAGIAAAVSAAGLDVAVVPYEGGAGVRVDSLAVFRPDRVATLQIPDNVTSVEVTVRSGTGGPPDHRTLTGSAACGLAGLINSLPTVFPIPRGGPRRPGNVDVLDFHFTGSDVHVTAQTGGRGYVHVTGADGTELTLEGGRGVDAAVRSALGLPVERGR